MNIIYRRNAPFVHREPPPVQLHLQHAPHVQAIKTMLSVLVVLLAQHVMPLGVIQERILKDVGLLQLGHVMGVLHLDMKYLRGIDY